ncbi:manganese and iron superoxide dismutase [Hypoxylon sp. FL1150]|nr:manganese and iron superoxide dismutase [Hypoxylon sp. FL1150]
MLRPRLRIPRPSRLWRPAISTRSIHHVPVLAQFDPREGVPGLLSPGGFDIAWTQYMQFVIEKLNNLTAGTEFEMQTVLQVLKATAREPHHAPIFNYASMAHNNALFFENIANISTETADDLNAESQEEQEPFTSPGEERIPPRLRRDLERQFSSVETLRREFLVTAMAMFGPGFVWLVKNAQTNDMRILTTYLAGTPYTAGHWRRQGLDMNTQGSLDAPATVKGWQERAQTGVGADTGGRFIPQNQLAPGGVDAIPLLCLNTWEHVWLRDYGVGAGGTGGKAQFVQAWWQCIDWNKVEGLSGIARVDLKMK